MTSLHEPANTVCFRVRRLPKPDFRLGIPLRFDLQHDIKPDPTDAQPIDDAAASTADQTPNAFADRVLLRHYSDASAMDGALDVPSTWGFIYLGEVLWCCVVLCNSSENMISGVGIRVELYKEGRPAVVLHDSTRSPLATLPPLAQHSFLVRQDVRELGHHVLSCSASYRFADGVERRIKQDTPFTVFNPVVVRTKGRTVLNDVFMEVCIQNDTKASMVVHSVTFDAMPHLTATPLLADAADARRDIDDVGDADDDGPLSAFMKSLQIIAPSGGMQNFLFKLSRKQPPLQPPPAADKLRVLGKVDIRWQRSMGEQGRLQTQLINAPSPTQPSQPAAAAAGADVEMSVLCCEQPVRLHEPFTLTLMVRNCTQHACGPFVLQCAAAFAGDGVGPASPRRTAATAAEGTSGIVTDGPAALRVERMAAYEARRIDVRLLPLQAAVQPLPPLRLLTGDGLFAAAAVLNPIDVFVLA